MLRWFEHVEKNPVDIVIWKIDLISESQDQNR